MVGKDLGRLAVARIASSRLSGLGSGPWRGQDRGATFRSRLVTVSQDSPGMRQTGPVTQQIQYVCADTERKELHERRAGILSFISARVLSL